ncbi:MAG: ATP-binding protein [Gammaproteobacteria bacterium]|nr:ATP-binding protein [Gammaproteobacteria bacterium]
MIKRKITSELLQAVKDYPIVTIIGPRQSGKTTLCKLTFPDYHYCSLEDPDIRAFALNDPRAFLNEYSSYVIFDEIQRVPELLSYLQGIVDTKQTKGQFILTGSHQLKLRAEITQSLAGRTDLLTLFPLTISEVLSCTDRKDRDELLFHGFFPRIYQDNLEPNRAYSNYYQTYIERDVRQLINLKTISLFEKFLKLLAGRVGQIINFNSLSNDVGVSSTTLKEWLAVLEVSFIIVKLEPYFENFGKRVIKSAKIYFIDTGLLAFLLNIESPKILARDPLIGNIFENMVVLESIKTRLNKGLQANLYFFRDSNGLEVDLLYKKGSQLIPIEIKSSSTFNKVFAKGLSKFQKLTNNSDKGYIIYAGDFTPKSERYEVVNFINTEKLFV